MNEVSVASKSAELENHSPAKADLHKSAYGRFERQRGLIDTQVLRSTTAAIIGVGAIGRQVAIQLASLGIGSMVLIDFDSVEEHNITSQGYLQDDIGRLKVDALASSIRGLDPTIELNLIQDRFRPNQFLAPVVFCCVDSISSRSAIWRSVQKRPEFWGDGRMLGEVIRVLTACDRESANHYGSTLFHQDEAQVGNCTSRSTIYAASIAAGLMIHQFTRWLRRLPTDSDLQFNVLSSELTVRG